MITSRRSQSQAVFEAQVDCWTQAAIADGNTTFSALLHRLPGVYPTEFLASLNRLAQSERLDLTVMASLRRQAASKGVALIEGRSLLPLPHPLDYEWRFTPDAARSLLDRAVGLTPSGGDLLLFGTPGLAIEALTLPIDRRLAFLAENNCVTDRVFALNQATGSPLSIAFCSGGLPRESADAVFLDPPWYVDFIRPMLAAAAHACRPGGAVLISLPPDGVRPSAEADRRGVIAFGRRLGLAIIEHSPLAIQYETPFFERNALAAVGLHPPPGWRRGDLIVFRKSPPARKLSPVYSSRRRDWTEVCIGRMRLFIGGAENVSPHDAGLSSLVNGDILPTVSRRDPRRRTANVWTSGNRIFRTDNPQLVLQAAISCSREEMAAGIQPGLWGTIGERAALERIAAELCELAAIEAQEEGNMPAVNMERSVVWRSSSRNYWSRSSAIISG
jgi:hypothetical protein